MIGDSRVQYDEAAKRLLAQKSLLALILKYTTEEFQEMTEEEIEECIEGVPEISSISVDPEEHMPRTEPACEPGNSGGKAAEQLEHPREIQGLSNESVIAGEGKVTYDIRFVVYRPGKIQKIKLMINIEAQKKWNPGYEIVTRGIFYCARMISGQKHTEFEHSDYDKIKKVYSIWICMNAPENGIADYQIVRKNHLGENQVSRQAYDKLAVVVVGLKPGSETNHRLVEVLSTLFSESMSLSEKEERLKACDVILTEEARKEAGSMCNLGEGIWERGVEAGIQTGIQQGIQTGIQQGIQTGIQQGQIQVIVQLIRNGTISVEAGAEVLKKSLEEMEQICKEA